MNVTERISDAVDQSRKLGAVVPVHILPTELTNVLDTLESIAAATGTEFVRPRNTP